MGEHLNAINVSCPDNNHSERIYIIKLLLEGYLGINCIINFENEISDYIIEFENKRIIIEDHFFNQYVENLSYLNVKSIPLGYKMLISKNLPIIYGRDLNEVDCNEIRCGLDIFASSFFLLTRWEEFVLPKRKDKLRCDENDLFLIKNNFYKRPLVNEYLDLLVDFFSTLEISIGTKRAFTVFQTHDVDWLYLSSFSDLIKNLYALIVNNKLYKKAILIFLRYLYYRLSAINPFDSFDDFMDFSETVGLKNSFYFKMCDQTEIGATYTYSDIRTKQAVQNIISRGHNIGFHPSENCTGNREQFDIEHSRLLKLAPNAIGGRQHHLIYQKNTLNAWNENNLKYDSGYGFQHRNGFRCGICYEFPVFDVFLRKELDLVEVPFVIMDAVFLRNKKTEMEMLQESKDLINVVKKYHGTLCTIWHTNLFKTVERKKYINTYFSIIRYALSE